MIKAGSLLYAVYICLIIAIICAALLYYANLYNALNLFYNLREDLYIHNQSAMNYALADDKVTEIPLEENPEINSIIVRKFHGLLETLIVSTTFKKDTISSIHFVGKKTKRTPALYLSNYSVPLSFSGNVKLIGDKFLPSKYIPQKHIHNSLNNLVATGSIEISGTNLPPINEIFKQIPIANNKLKQTLQLGSESKGVVNSNSFLKETILVRINSNVLDNVIFKGNYILKASDSISIKKSAILEDVIIIANKVKIEDGFKGNVQVFAKEKIKIEENVVLKYPSIVAINNNSDKKTEITIGENTAIYGAITLFGSSILKIDENKIILNKNSKVIGDVYCSGKLMMNGFIYGSVYTNKVFTITKSGMYENCIVDAVIDNTKRPKYFVSIPFFGTKNNDEYAITKKGF